MSGSTTQKHIKSRYITYDLSHFSPKNITQFQLFYFRGLLSRPSLYCLCDKNNNYSTEKTNTDNKNKQLRNLMSVQHDSYHNYLMLISD